MATTLPAPEVVGREFEDAFEPRLPAVRLRWRPPSAGPAERLWDLPEGICLVGPAPERFGVGIRRREADAYAVRLVWNHTCFRWRSLSRAQLLTTALAPLLRAMGTDLYALLEQPVNAETGLPREAA